MKKLAILLILILFATGCKPKIDPKSCSIDSDCEYKRCLGCVNKNSDIEWSCPEGAMCECIGPFENVVCECKDNECIMSSVS